jgi:iron complex transport system substrate-binding protein
MVTLLPSLTETVCALQACGRLVGTDRYSNWPAQVRQLPKLGGLEDTQIERLVRSSPTWCWRRCRRALVDRLKALGLRVLALEPKSLADTGACGRAGPGLGKPAGPRLWAQMTRA